ncbi:MAG: hypothetical protein V1899_02105 [Planctomycetota bacterium]
MIHMLFMVLAFFCMVVGQSCSSGGGSTYSIDQANQDTQVIQDLIPVLDAGFVVMPSVSSSANIAKMSKSIGPWNTPADFPATPQELYDKFYTAKDDFARYPASGYLQDFYDVQGNLGYMELKKSTDGWGAFQVSLYVHPSLSTSVYYTLEQYRVPADDWTYFVNRNTGLHDPLAFEKIASYYYDGREETRTLEWSRYVDGTVYVVDFFGMPDDFNDKAYSYPEKITDPDKVAAADVGYSSEYAAKTTFTVDSSEDCKTNNQSVNATDKHYCSFITGTEFYDQLLDPKASVTKYTKSFYTEDVQFKDGTKITGNSVRIDSSDPDQVKNMRAKTTSNYLYAETSRQYVQTEKSRTHDDNADGKANYDYELSSMLSENYGQVANRPVYSVSAVMNLEETTAGANEYEGSITVTRGKVKTYKVSLDVAKGLKISGDASIEEFTFPIAAVGGKSVTETREITAVINGHTFVGTYSGGIISGTLTSGGVSHTITANATYAVIGD